VPIVRIDLLQGKSPQYRAQAGEVIYQPMIETINLPRNDRFQVITKPAKSGIPFDPDYLGIQRTDDCIVDPYNL
jgi:4-oxalocrotonate tautomerase